jgi:sulfotransferase
MHAIAGLPRSGSTLLSAILKQNPKFVTGVTSPVYNLMMSTLEQMSAGKEFSPFFNDERRRNVLLSLFSGYYGDAGRDKIIFDTSRLWTGKLTLLAELFPNCRVVCCVRDVGWIIDSVERMVRKNPLQTSRVFGFRAGDSVYSRTRSMMDSESALIGKSWNSLHEAWCSEEASRIILVRYESLAGAPGAVIEQLYEALGEPSFSHDFENLNFDEENYDHELGMPGLHTVRPSVRLEKRRPCIPPDLFRKYADMSFWNHAENNVRGVKVI